MLKDTIKAAMSAVGVLADSVMNFVESPVELVLRRKLSDTEKKALRGVVIIGIAVAHVILNVF